MSVACSLKSCRIFRLVGSWAWSYQFKSRLFMNVNSFELSLLIWIIELNLESLSKDDWSLWIFFYGCWLMRGIIPLMRISIDLCLVWWHNWYALFAMTRVRVGGVECPRKVTSYLSIYSLFARAILIYVICGLEMSKDKEYRGQSASGSLGLITWAFCAS